MQRQSFRGVDLDNDHYYTYARDRDRALSHLGPRIYDSVVPGLSSKVQATSVEKDALFFHNLLTNDGSSQDTFMSKEVGIKYALDIASASKVVELSASSPYSFLDQRQLDRLQEIQ